MRSAVQLELRSLFASRSLWVLSLLTGPLVGYSFIQAISLYGEASKPALVTPQLAVGLNPFDGVIIPTYGAIYLVLTLLFPFVAIRAISTDKDSGALRLLFQTPLRSSTLLAAKAVSVLFAWLIVELPSLLVLLIWRLSGGHVFTPETLCLLFGHFLYGVIVAFISLFAAAVAESASTAALLALACTLGSWVLDFAAVGGNSWLAKISELSLSALLKPFEQGLLVWKVVGGIAIMTAGLFALTLLWWHPGRPLATKVRGTATVIIFCIALFVPLRRVTPSLDLTEDQRHSFSPVVRTALQQIRDPVRITVYLAPEDPRMMDFDRSILAKLRRALPRTEVVNLEADQTAIFRTGEDPNYGLVIYDVGSRRAESRSTSPEEILPLLWNLTGVPPPTADDPASYPGYPLVVNSSWAHELVFYALCPALTFVGWLLLSRR
jgi:ABC-2 type transport system permease protein